MNNIEKQSEEIFALQSIYDEKELIIEDENPPKGRFIANIPLQNPFHIYCGGTSKVGNSSTYKVEYLPPVNLFFEFPATYPSQSCPSFLLSCSWLSLDQLSSLCKKLELLWDENDGDVVLFRWIDFLVSEVLNFLGIKDTLDITNLSSYKFSLRKVLNVCEEPNSVGQSYTKELIEETTVAQIKEESQQQSESREEEKMQVVCIKPSIHGGSGVIDCRAILDLTNGTMLLPLLLKYDNQKKYEFFLSSWITCDICYLQKKGEEFLKFNRCNHIYCKECLKSYFEVQIKEGNVHALNCPAEKCESQAEAEEVKQLVSLELFQKYDILLLSRSLESMDDVVYCPRKVCQSPLITDPTSNMGCCPACSYVFCLFCHMAYHGVAPCNLKIEKRKELSTKYLEGSTEEKIRLEKQYGKREIKILVDNVLSEEWVSSNSKQCPHCHTQIEKTDGCNKMTCFKCGTFFCWRCMARLSQTNPYSHYNDHTVPCFNQLFPQEEIDIMPGEFLDFYH